jgi:hypothetical protein
VSSLPCSPMRRQSKRSWAALSNAVQMPFVPKGDDMDAVEQEKVTATLPLDTDTRVEILLKEYELCTNDANHLEEVIWTTAGILFTASIAGIGVLGGTVPASPKPYDYLLRITLSILSIIFLWSWKAIASRWYSIQRMMYYRIVEIEEELEMYKERYVSYLDKAVEGKPYPQTQRINTVVEAMRAKHIPGGVRRTVNNIVWILSVVWLLFLVSQVAAMIGWI